MLTSQFIITAAPELQRSALAELKAVDPGLKIVGRFSGPGSGVFMIKTELSTACFSEALIRADPIFVRHVMPVQAEFAITGQGSRDLSRILEHILRTGALQAGECFAVQCRRAGQPYDYTAKDVEVHVGSAFEAWGAVPTFSDTAVAAEDAQKVISIYLHDRCGYVGLSTVWENLNEHSDECRIFSRTPCAVNRAECKLKEALRKFRLAVPQGWALDLGAAPGGWTKVLADAGMHVVAVDPARLHPKVAGHPNVTHVQRLAQDFAGARVFDLLVNDINTEPEDSARLTVQMAPSLRPGAWAILTVKLVARQHPFRLLAAARTVLEPTYQVVRAKHLFHNRLEVTLLLCREAAPQPGVTFTGFKDSTHGEDER